MRMRSQRLGERATERKDAVARARQGEKDKWRGEKRSKSRGRLLEDLSEKRPGKVAACAIKPTGSGAVVMDKWVMGGRATSGT